jgi:gas vesicle protein
MKEIVYFMLGVAVGSLVALLFAPERGEELRAQIQDTARTDYYKLRAEWDEEAAKIHKRIDQLQAQAEGDKN